MPDELIADLIKMGHTVKAVRPPYPSINVVLKSGGPSLEFLSPKNIENETN